MKYVNASQFTKQLYCCFVCRVIKNFSIVLCVLSFPLQMNCLQKYPNKEEHSFDLGTRDLKHKIYQQDNLLLVFVRSNFYLKFLLEHNDELRLFPRFIRKKTTINYCHCIRFSLSLRSHSVTVNYYFNNSLFKQNLYALFFQLDFGVDFVL